MASRAAPLMLGALAVSSGVAILTFNIIFSVTLSSSSSPLKVKVIAIEASALSLITALLLLLLLGRQARYRNGAHIQDLGRGRRHTYLVAGSGAAFGTLSAVASAIYLGMMRARMAALPPRIMGTPTENLVIGGFVVWAVSLLSQALFVICMVIIQRRDFQHQIQPYRAEPELQAFPEMAEPPRQQASMAHNTSNTRATPSIGSNKSPPSTGRSRAGSDTMSSSRSSLSQVVRPITSRTKLIQGNHKSPYPPTSIDPGHRDGSSWVEDGFDSWDTSGVDAHARHAVESASPTPPRFLETIPASPTGSRSPSPGFPLNLEPPKTRKRSRSYSPVNSIRRENPKSPRNVSPTESTNEAHIHPLFRTDSPTPAPEATPGTVVTAAPNAGQIISSRESIRSIHRIRSGSAPPTPLIHAGSLESIRHIIEQEEAIWIEGGGERTLTPPIPDFILNGGPRNSMQGYIARRTKSQTGLGKVGGQGWRSL